MKYPWPLWVYPVLLACLGQSGFCLLGCLLYTSDAADE